MAFASGLATEHAVLSLLNPGDSIVACDDLYGGTYRLFERIVGRYNIETEYVTVGDTPAYKKAMRPSTKMVWLEALVTAGANDLFLVGDAHQSTAAPG